MRHAPCAHLEQEQVQVQITVEVLEQSIGGASRKNEQNILGLLDAFTLSHASDHRVVLPSWLDVVSSTSYLAQTNVRP